MSEGRPELEAVASLLEDETVREILTRTSVEPMSARQLKDHCDASGPTIYRRLERLRDADLVVKQTRPDTDEGHHRQVYAPNVERIVVELDEGSLSIDVKRHETMADRFTRLIEDV
jgi:DNA-binding transcriptional ArsR family regulator